ncbi:hypothetical protein TrRE_jg6240, partial [Triparma retinervis]
MHKDDFAKVMAAEKGKYGEEVDCTADAKVLVRYVDKMNRDYGGVTISQISTEWKKTKTSEMDPIISGYAMRGKLSKDRIERMTVQLMIKSILKFRIDSNKYGSNMYIVPGPFGGKLLESKTSRLTVLTVDMDISYWDDSLQTEIQSVTELMRTLNSSSGSDRSNRINDVESKLSRIRNILKSFKMETRLIKDGIVRRSFEQKYDDYDARIKTLTSEAKWAKTSGNKRELFGGAASSSHTAEEEGDAMLNRADALQDKTEESLQHTRQMVDATKDVAVATLEELHRQ